MDKVKLKFTLKGRKDTYFRRFDLFGKPLTTTNVNSAKSVKESDVKTILKKLIIEYGKDNIKDLAIFKG